MTVRSIESDQRAFPKLRSKQRGQGRPVVLLHGLFGNAENLGMIARGLEDNWSVVSLDLPGHGDSPLLNDMSLCSMAQCVLQSLQSLELSKPIIIGHSLGGKVAMQLAAMAPDYPAALIVLDIAPVDYAHGHKDIFAAVSGVDLATVHSRSDADRALARVLTERDVRQFILTNLRKTASQGYQWKIDFAALQRNYSFFAEAPAAGQIFNRPVLVIKGGESAYIQSKHEPAFRQRFSDLDFKLVPEAGHWLHAEKTELLVGMIRRFIIKLDGGLE